jgi:hypothetical protein
MRVSTKSIASAVAALGLTVAVAAGGQASTRSDPSPEPVAAQATAATGDSAEARPTANYPACAVNITPRGYHGFIIWIPTKSRDYAAESRRCLLSTANGGSDLVGTLRLQLALVHCYQEDIATDGRYGDKTRKAVVRTQDSAEVYPADGIYGPVTHNNIYFYGPDGTCDIDTVHAVS